MNNVLLEVTESICPVCLKKIEAEYIGNNNKVYMEKSCVEHGNFSVIVWDDVDSWTKWKENLSVPSNIHFQREYKKGCPYDCGICSSHLQETCCVLLEVTSKCNLKCPVCFASSKTNDKKDPSLVVIKKWYEMLLNHGGPFNIQLSGGEPTLRDDLDEIISIGKTMGFDFFQINTNGIRIGNDIDYLKKLVNAGLNTVFLQFDGFKEETLKSLRGENILDAKLNAISNCKDLNVGVILVPTVKKGVNDSEVGDILRFASKNIPVIRGVNFQPMSFFGRYNEIPRDEDRITIPELLNEIEIQMNGEIKFQDFSPGSAEHPHCSFHADYTIKNNKWIHNVNESSKCCGTSSKSRSVVAKKWSAPIKINNIKIPNNNDRNLYNVDSLDKFLMERNYNTLSISGMAFQDVWNLDLNRLKMCYIHEISQDGKLIPFCSYNLTSINGETLYRGKDI